VDVDDGVAAKVDELLDVACASGVLAKIKSLETGWA